MNMKKEHPEENQRLAKSVFTFCRRIGPIRSTHCGSWARGHPVALASRTCGGLDMWRTASVCGGRCAAPWQTRSGAGFPFQQLSTAVAAPNGLELTR
jgi:hypothetical protein